MPDCQPSRTLLRRRVQSGLVSPIVFFYEVPMLIRIFVWTRALIRSLLCLIIHEHGAFPCDLLRLVLLVFFILVLVLKENGRSARESRGKFMKFRNSQHRQNRLRHQSHPRHRRQRSRQGCLLRRRPHRTPLRGLLQLRRLPHPRWARASLLRD